MNKLGAEFDRNRQIWFVTSKYPSAETITRLEHADGLTMRSKLRGSSQTGRAGSNNQGVESGQIQILLQRRVANKDSNAL